MALFRGDIRSSVMQMDTSINIILPYDRPVENQQDPCKVIYLLHGIKQNSTDWTRWTDIEAYVKENGVALVFPEGYRGFYTDMVYGPAYYTYLSQELPELVCKMFGVSGKREDTFVAGLSMGGYGALKLALRNPERFAGAASFSAVTDPLDYSLNMGGPLTEKEAPAIWGEELQLQKEDDLFLLAEKASRLPQADRPRIYSCCGTEDFLYQQNLKLKAKMEELPFDYTYEEWSGIHDWDFWKPAVIKGLDHLLKK